MPWFLAEVPRFSESSTRRIQGYSRRIQETVSGAGVVVDHDGFERWMILVADRFQHARQSVSPPVVQDRDCDGWTIQCPHLREGLPSGGTPEMDSGWCGRLRSAGLFEPHPTPG